MEVTAIYACAYSGERTEMPMFTVPVWAGNQVLGDSVLETRIDLNEYLVKHPASTFFAKVKCIEPVDRNISDGDILIVDTSIEPTDGKYTLVDFNGLLSVKIYRDIDGEQYFVSLNSQFLPLSMQPLMDMRCIGVVTKVIHTI